MLDCIITSSEETKRYEGVKKISLPAFSGQIQVLIDHAESFLLLEKGDIVLQKKDGSKETVFISGGECHVQDNRVSVILQGD